MLTIFRNSILAAFCGLFILLSTAAAQEKSSGKPAEADKNNKIDKVEKTEPEKKNKNGLAPITLEDLATEFPDVAGWEKSEIQKYPTEALGFSVNYESNAGGKVTIYVYNGGNKKIGDGVEDKIVVSELKKAKGEIQQIADMGYYENLKEVKSETITLGGAAGKLKSLYTLYTMGPKGRLANSEIYIFGHQNRFIKIRATRPRENSEGDKMVADLLKEIDAYFAQ